MKTIERNKYKSKYKFSALTVRSAKNWNGIPAFLRERFEPETSLFLNFNVSLVSHLMLFFLLWLLIGVFKIGVVTPLFNQKPKVKDIQFILDTPNKPKRVIKQRNIPQPKALQEKQVEKKESSPAKAIRQDKSFVKNFDSNNLFKSVRKSNTKGHTSAPKASKDPGAFSIPVPKLGPVSTGHGGLGRRGGSSSGHSHFGAASSGGGDINGDANGVGGSSGGHGFDKATTRKMISSFDIGPYVSELKRNIRWNWRPVKEQNKRVELFMRIAKDGRVVILNVKRTSEVAAVDNAALDAVRKAMPLNPLPAKYTKSYLDVVFTFDSASIGSRY